MGYNNGNLVEATRTEDSDVEIGDNPVDGESPPTINECIQAIRNIAKRFIASTGKVPNTVTEVEQALLSLPQ